MPGPPIGGGPAAGTISGDAITLPAMPAVIPMLLSGDSNIPIGGEELGVPLGVPTAGVPLVVTVAAPAVDAASPLSLSSERM